MEIVLSELTENPGRVVFEFEVIFRRWCELVSGASFIKWALRKFISDTGLRVDKKDCRKRKQNLIDVHIE